MSPTLPPPYWQQAARALGAGSEFPVLKGALQCDVVIVGAGILGLNCALALAKRGVDVIVLDAQHPAAGASGRNGGLVVPSLPRLGPADVMQALGPQFGERMVSLVAQSAQGVFDLIDEHGLACDAVQSGWLNPSHAAELNPGLQKRVTDWQRAGARATWLDARSARKRIGSAGFHGALFDPSGGHLNPYAYTEALARAAEQAGARLFCHSPVLEIQSREGKRIAITPAGCVSADQVVQCTNATPSGMGELTPAVDRSFVPLHVFQLATQPVPPAVRETLLPGNEALSDTRNNLFALRYTADGRIVTGGMAPLTQWFAATRLRRSLAHRMARIFPQWPQIRFDYLWQGVAALTPDFLPRLFEVDSQWLAPLGCNGRGIAMSTALGQRIAQYLLERDAQVLPLPITRPAPIRAHPVARLAPQLLLPLGMIQDAMRR